MRVVLLQFTSTIDLLPMVLVICRILYKHVFGYGYIVSPCACSCTCADEKGESFVQKEQPRPLASLLAPPRILTASLLVRTHTHVYHALYGGGLSSRVGVKFNQMKLAIGQFAP